MKISILFGTESGNGELAADDLAEFLTIEHDVHVRDLATFSPAELTGRQLFIFICSTYGEGDLPNTALPFFTALNDSRPDLNGVEFAIFGLGDSFYTETYGQGATKLDAALTALGAHRLGEIGRHDASTWEPVGETAINWLEKVLEDAKASTSAA